LKEKLTKERQREHWDR